MLGLQSPIVRPVLTLPGIVCYGPLRGLSTHAGCTGEINVWWLGDTNSGGSGAGVMQLETRDAYLA